MSFGERFYIIGSEQQPGAATWRAVAAELDRDQQAMVRYVCLHRHTLAYDAAVCARDQLLPVLDSQRAIFLV